MNMRFVAMLVLTGSVAAAQAPTSPAPSAPPAPTEGATISPRPVGTMSQLMVDIIYPTSDALFYISTRPLESGPAWTEFQNKMLMLAESANLLMMPVRARDEDQWMKDSKLLLDVGTAAYKAARAKDVDALSALNEPLLASCTTCHMHFRPNYGRRRQPQTTPQPSQPQQQ